MRWGLWFFILFFSASCHQNQLSSSGSQNALSSPTYYISSSSQVRVFQAATTDVGGLGVFVTELSSAAGVLQIPTTLTGGSYGTRTDPSVAQPLDLVVKVYDSGHPSGDFIFEAPLLSTSVQVTNVTTALYWLLKWGYVGSGLKISTNSFTSVVNSIELTCTNCREQTTSQVLSLIQSRSDLMQNIQTILASENPSLSLSYSWAPESIYYAWSSPILNLNGYGAQSSTQEQSTAITLIGVQPTASTVPLMPSSWTLSRLDGTTQTLNMSQLNYTFTNNDQTSVNFVPTYANSAQNTWASHIEFFYEVSRAALAPVCSEPISVSMKANRINSFDLTTVCSDPTDPTTAPDLGVTYALVSGPAGMTVTSAGLLKWSPTNALAGQSYSFQILVTSSTSQTHVASGSVTVNLVALPTFTSTLTGLSFTEGVSQTIPIETSDPAGDPIVLTVTAVETLQVAYPTGAGVLTSYTSGGTTTAPEFQWSFMPSYLQTIGGNGTLHLIFSLKYNTTADPTLDGTQTLASLESALTIINAADPPVWDTQPQTADLTVGQAFSISGGSAHDPAPNPTALTFSFQSTDGRCDWSSTASVSGDGSGNVTFSGAPSLISYDTCSFEIIATDANGLSSPSQAVTYNVTDAYSPIATLAGITEIDGVENQIVILPLSQMFDDPNLDGGDPRDTFTWSCGINTDGSSNYSTACSALNINFTLSANSFTGSWFAPYGSAGTYYINLTVTNSGGETASYPFKLVITASAAPMLLAIEQNGSAATTLTATEGVTGSFTLDVQAQSANAIDQYDYYVSTPSCYVSSGTATACSATLIANPSSMEATGSQDFVFTLSPSYTDGNNTYPAASATYILSFVVTKADDPTVFSTTSVTLTVNNVDRPPTAIGLSSGSQGCTGSSANSLTTAFSICINLSNNSKSGTTWLKTYAMTLSVADLDGTNNSYSYSFLTTTAPGTISGSTWTIKLPSCLNAGTGTVTRSYELQVSDGRGGTTTREVDLKIMNGLAASSCL